MTAPETFAALRWWLLLLVLGTAAFPLVFVIFKRLPDKGYAFTKMAGLLLVSYLFWMAGSLGFLGNNTGGMVVSIVVVAVIAFVLYRRSITDGGDDTTSQVNSGASIIDWLKRNRSQVLLTELVFALLFFLWVWVRSQNPAIAATEKPMEFAFLNAVGRSPAFPPLDPWLSGYAISYYYFGYVMTSLIARLALVPEQIAFNLAVAWLVAGAGTGAFGLVFNLLRAQGAAKSARLLAMTAAVALPLVGNLTIGFEIAHANGAGSPEFWQWLDVRDLDQPPVIAETPRFMTTNWWWWRSSRPLREYHLSGRPEDGLEPIAEFPSFSFVLGDLHPHVLALPFAFLSLALALAWWLPGKYSGGREPPWLSGWEALPWSDRIKHLIQHIGLPLWLFTALVLGGLAFLNTWDVLIHLFVVLGAFALARWREEGWTSHIVTQTIMVAGLLLVPIIILYLPFFLGFRSQAGAPYLLPMFMRPTRLVQFLIIFGMPLLAIIIFLIALIARQRFRYWKSGLTTAVALLALLFFVALLFSFIVAASSEGAVRLSSMASELDISLPARPQQTFAFGWAVTSLAAISPSYIAARISYPALTLFLAAVAGMVVMVWREQLGQEYALERSEAAKKRGDVLPFVLLLIATGVLLTLGPEFIFLRDNFGARMNTIFKFYYQAWVMFGISAVYAIGYLWLSWRGAGRLVPSLATAGYALLFLIGLLFPIYAVNSRSMEYRGPVTAADRLPATLDGLAQMNLFNPGDYEAIHWLRENIDGTPVILEAVGGQYTGYGRISAATGLPTLLGWAGHEYQWRGSTPEPAAREPAARDIYSAAEIEEIAAQLDNYDVRYIVVGGLERDTYDPSGLDKFAENLDIAFQNNGVTIYRWQPQ